MPRKKQDSEQSKTVQNKYSLTQFVDFWAIHNAADEMLAFGDAQTGWFAWLPSGKTAKGRDLGKAGFEAARRALVDDEAASSSCDER